MRDHHRPKYWCVLSARTIHQQKGHPALGSLFLTRENSSNGVLNRQNLLAKSYESKKGSVKGFFGNKHLCFQWFIRQVNTDRDCRKLRLGSPASRLNRVD